MTSLNEMYAVSLTASRYRTMKLTELLRDNFNAALEGRMPSHHLLAVTTCEEYAADIMNQIKRYRKVQRLRKNPTVSRSNG